MFWPPWGIDVIVALMFVYFFFVGLGDGSVSSFNIVLWLIILCVSAAIVGGSLALRARGRTVLAIALVTIIAVPSVLIGLFFLALLATPAH
jgi:ABC-type tungstate transport system substrate-binding protein